MEDYPGASPCSVAKHSKQNFPIIVKRTDFIMAETQLAANFPPYYAKFPRVATGI